MSIDIDENKENILVVFSNSDKDVNFDIINEIENIFNDKYNIYIGSPLGGIIQMVLNEEGLKDRINMDRKSFPFDLLDPSKFQALIVPSLYGALIDLSNNQRLGYIINEMNKNNKILCFIGFGVSALLSVRINENIWPFDSYTLTGPTLFEELNQKPLEFSAPALHIESFLRSNGAEYTCSKDQNYMVKHMVVCSNLITAQNSYSFKLAISTVKYLLDS